MYSINRTHRWQYHVIKEMKGLVHIRKGVKLKLIFKLGFQVDNEKAEAEWTSLFLLQDFLAA